MNRLSTSSERVLREYLRPPTGEPVPQGQLATQPRDADGIAGMPLEDLLRAAKSSTSRNELGRMASEVVQRWEDSMERRERRPEYRAIAGELAAKPTIREGDRRYLYNTILRR